MNVPSAIAPSCHIMFVPPVALTMAGKLSRLKDGKEGPVNYSSSVKRNAFPCFSLP
jgi:hypothetical protein